MSFLTKTDVNLVQPETGLRRRLPIQNAQSYRYFKWSPSGEWLLYSQDGELFRSNWRGNILDENILETHQITQKFNGDPLSGTRSPDENWIISPVNYNNTHELWLISTDGAIVQELQLDKRYPQLASFQINHWINWSNDSQWIYIINYHLDRTAELMKMGYDGQSLEVIAELNHFDYGESYIWMVSSNRYIILQSSLSTGKLEIIRLDDRIIRTFSTDGFISYFLKELNDTLTISVSTSTPTHINFVKINLDDEKLESTVVHSIVKENQDSVSLSQDRIYIASTHNDDVIIYSLRTESVSMIRRQQSCMQPIWTVDNKWLIYGDGILGNNCLVYRIAPDGTRKQPIYELNNLRFNNDVLISTDHPNWLRIIHFDGSQSLLRIDGQKTVPLGNSSLVAWNFAQTSNSTIHHPKLLFLSIGMFLVNISISVVKNYTNKSA